MNSHLNLDIFYHNIVKIGVLFNAFAESHVAKCKAFFGLSNVFVSYFFQKLWKCTEHCSWSVIYNFEFDTIFVMTTHMFTQTYCS